MFRNKLTKWKAVAFRNIENRTFAARPLSTLNISTPLTNATTAKTIISSSKVTPKTTERILFKNFGS